MVQDHGKNHLMSQIGKVFLMLMSQLDIVFLVFGALALVFGVPLYFSNKSKTEFVNEELPRWTETECIFLDFHVADSGIRNADDDYRWWVNFEYTLEYYVDGTKKTATDMIERSGFSKRSMIPENEFIQPYHTGEKTFIVFDPDDPSIYKIGSKDSIAAEQRQYSDTASRLYIVLIPLGSLLIIVGVFMMFLFGRGSAKHPKT